ncbi:MAG: hypothetical protein C0631_02725, partial [Sedimenticola sp.]
ILFKVEDFDLHEQKGEFERVFSLINEKVGDEAFTRFNDDGRPTGRLAPAYYEASVCAFSTNYDSIQTRTPGEVKERLFNAFNDQEFLNATGPGANTIPKLESRIEVVTRHLA